MTDNIKVIKFQSDFDGRLIYVDFNLNRSSNISYRLVNLYSPTESSERNTFLNSIIPYLVVAKNLILTGDYNFVLDLKLDKIGGNLEKNQTGSKVFKNIINKHKPNISGNL